MKQLIGKLGFDPARLEMYNLSAAMGPRWAQICTEFVERMRSLGPSPVRAAQMQRQCQPSGDTR